MSPAISTAYPGKTPAQRQPLEMYRFDSPIREATGGSAPRAPPADESQLRVLPERADRADLAYTAPHRDRAGFDRTLHRLNQGSWS